MRRFEERGNAMTRLNKKRAEAPVRMGKQSDQRGETEGEIGMESPE
jgi:hypothetical protein